MGLPQSQLKSWLLAYASHSNVGFVFMNLSWLLKLFEPRTPCSLDLLYPQCWWHRYIVEPFEQWV